ncbi:VOC family protein [Asticcacaulis sp. AC402]|uniref:VOC family protein n=1 Tax=Asticcacaulis sp. AC402 TaxID=1282361 RepID=UPI0003C3B227|nr:VOC family protein [Asticcacaulis sp. AC402]ESQ74860.1 hypothetical protein ABAC402_11955 [Asticcacaulis sp. AC402]
MTVRITPHLAFNGTCRDAFAFYAEVLGGEITLMMTHGESPMTDQFPPEWADAVLHATLTLDRGEISGADAPPEIYAKPAGTTVTLTFDDRDEAERVFTALAKGGSIYLDFAETFWSKGFGMCTDRYDQHWMINTVGEM